MGVEDFETRALGGRCEFDDLVARVWGVYRV